MGLLQEMWRSQLEPGILSFSMAIRACSLQGAPLWLLWDLCGRCVDGMCSASIGLQQEWHTLAVLVMSCEWRCGDVPSRFLVPIRSALPRVKSDVILCSRAVSA